jgi:hypothetical protein
VRDQQGAVGATAHPLTSTDGLGAHLHRALIEFGKTRRLGARQCKVMEIGTGGNGG